ncbi:hypothetical protein ABZP36_010781 [Zizania latifolia]
MASSKRSLVVLMALAVLRRCYCTAPAAAAQPTKNQTRPPGLFVFGDSIVDSGNNNAITTLVRCNFPPYGQDFPGHNATGRFSNGKVPGDILATQMGIKQYVPAYLGAELSDFDLLTGVSFASGGCGFDPLTAELVSVLTMDNQLDLFKEYKEKLLRIAGARRAAEIVSESLYLVVTGTDDLANTYFTTPFRRDYDLDSYIDFVVQCASDFIQVIHRPKQRTHPDRRSHRIHHSPSSSSSPAAASGTRAEAVRPGRAAGEHRRLAAHRVRAVAADQRRRARQGVRRAVQPGRRRVQRPARAGDQAAQRHGGGAGHRAQVHRPLHAAARHDPAPRRLRVRGDQPRVLRDRGIRGDADVQQVHGARLQGRRQVPLLGHLPSHGERLQHPTHADHKQIWVLNF